MIEITDSCIEKVEIKFGFSFDEESKEFIKCLESKDIKACPGAGKTTSLVAKLDVLSKHMPFSDNSGVLVLTHTNVAVDEIKKKLGINVKTLLSYPNHIGTFQSFINKFLATPMYIKIFGKKPERIDSEIFYKIFQERFNSCNNFHRNWLQDRADEKHTNVLTFIENFDIDDNSIKYNDRNIITTNSNMFQAIKTISNIPYSVINSGYLAYHHCYDLALKYLNDYPDMKDTFQKRFQYVFVDEVQDTDDKQFDILNKLFSDSNVVIQKIGDNNQAIFNSLKSDSSGWQTNTDFLEIKNTKRLSGKISNIVANFALEPQELEGSSSVEINPVILLFDVTNIGTQVLNEFAKIIIENDLHSIENAKFKAVGAVKEHETKYAISDYFPDFKKDNNESLEYDSLIEKLNLFDKTTIYPKDLRTIVLDVIIEYLKLVTIKNENKYFTKKSLLLYLKTIDKSKHDNFQFKILNSMYNLNVGICVLGLIKEKLEIVLELFDKSFDENLLSKIIKNYKLEFTKITNKNNYIYSNDEIELSIDISTIHKVKGETHTATLILESFNRAYDLKQLLKLLKGQTLNNPSLALKNKIKLLYVAMSRPTHLLCLAMNKEHVTIRDKTELENIGFIVKNIS